MENLGNVTLSDNLLSSFNQIQKLEETEKLIPFLIKEIELSRKDYENIERIRKTTENLCKKKFADCTVFTFGSSANGLGIKGSDVDLLADIGCPNTELDISLPKRRRKFAKEKAVDVAVNSYLGRAIKKSRSFCNVIFISSARVPIVKYESLETGLSVDLSHKNPMPWYNTQMIRTYNKSHPLVRPFLMMLKLWGKKHEISGGGKPQILITSYAFSLMGLFILMRRKDPIIPPFKHMQRRKAAMNNSVMNDVWIGPWLCSFDDDLTNWTKKEHKVTIIELMKEFFEFYSELSPGEFIISTNTGIVICVETFIEKNLKHLPKEMAGYCRSTSVFQKNCLCVQDPIDHSFNCTRNLMDYAYKRFQAVCKQMIPICSEILSERCALSELFIPNSTVNASIGIPTTVSTGISRPASAGIPRNHTVSFTLPPVNILEDGTIKKDQLFPLNESAVNLINFIFMHILLLKDINSFVAGKRKLEESSPQSTKKLKTFGGETSNITLLEQYYLVNQDVWSGRDEVASQMTCVPDESCLQRQKRLTSEMKCGNWTAFYKLHVTLCVDSTNKNTFCLNVVPIDLKKSHKNKSFLSCMKLIEVCCHSAIENIPK